MSRVRFGERLRAFLDEKHPVMLGTTRSDGTVQMNPLWFEYRDGLIWLNGGPARDWFRHLRRDSQATLLVIDGDNMFRWVQIQTRLVDQTTDGADEHIEHLSQRYSGRPYPAPKVDRLIVRLEPVRVTGGENRQPWDVTPEDTAGSA